MKKKRNVWVVLLLLIAMFVYAAFILYGNSEDRTIKQFLECWLSNSEETRNIHNLYMEMADCYREGADEETIQDAEENFEKAIEETYREYMTDTAIEQSMKRGLYAIAFPIYEENWKSEIKSISIEEDTSYYKFAVQLKYGAKTEKEGEIAGRLEMKDGKINIVTVTNMPF